MYSFLGGVASSSDGLFDHPTEDITIAGEAIQPLPSTFHGLLQTVSDLMLLLPVGSSLQVCYYMIVFLRIVEIVFMFFIYSHCFADSSGRVSPGTTAGGRSAPSARSILWATRATATSATAP